MAKKTTNNPRESVAAELLGLLAALFFMHSVATSAQHTLFERVLEGRHPAESPAIPLLIFGLLVVAYYWYKKRSVSVLAIITLTIFAVSGYLWVFGLRANS